MQIESGVCGVHGARLSAAKAELLVARRLAPGSEAVLLPSRKGLPGPGVDGLDFCLVRQTETLLLNVPVNDRRCRVANGRLRSGGRLCERPGRRWQAVSQVLSLVHRDDGAGRPGRAFAIRIGRGAIDYALRDAHGAIGWRREPSLAGSRAAIVGTCGRRTGGLLLRPRRPGRRWCRLVGRGRRHRHRRTYLWGLRPAPRCVCTVGGSDEHDDHEQGQAGGRLRRAGSPHRARWRGAPHVVAILEPHGVAACSFWWMIKGSRAISLLHPTRCPLPTP